MTRTLVAEETATDVGVGAIAGVVSVTLFTVLHHVFISPIWWMYPIMAIAGAVSGFCLAWCYAGLVKAPSDRSWAIFIGLFTLMFGLLAVVSSLIYEPIITMAEVVNSTGGNPIPISETMGLMAVFTLGWAGLLTLAYRRGWRGFGVALIATSVLMLLLGVNVSTMGLVEIPRAGWILVLEFFGYLLAIGASYGFCYSWMRKSKKDECRRKSGTGPWLRTRGRARVMDQPESD